MQVALCSLKVFITLVTRKCSETRPVSFFFVCLALVTDTQSCPLKPTELARSPNVSTNNSSINADKEEVKEPRGGAEDSGLRSPRRCAGALRICVRPAAGAIAGSVPALLRERPLLSRRQVVGAPGAGPCSRRPTVGAGHSASGGVGRGRPRQGPFPRRTRPPQRRAGGLPQRTAAGRRWALGPPAGSGRGRGWTEVGAGPGGQRAARETGGLEGENLGAGLRPDTEGARFQ